MDQSEGPRLRNVASEVPVALEQDNSTTIPSTNPTMFGYHNDEAVGPDGDDLDEVQPYTRCNACWGRCMPRRCCIAWFDMWPCCRPVGMRIPRDDPMNPRTNLRLLFLTMMGILLGLIGGFIVRNYGAFYSESVLKHVFYMLRS